jgi:hypothetical protein
VLGRFRVQISARRSAIPTECLRGFPVPPRKCRYILPWNWATTASFQFTYHPFIRPYLARVTEKACSINYTNKYICQFHTGSRFKTCTVESQLQSVARECLERMATGPLRWTQNNWDLRKCHSKRRKIWKEQGRSAMSNRLSQHVEYNQKHLLLTAVLRCNTSAAWTCFTSHNTRKGMFSLSAIVLPSSPSTHVSTSNSQRSLQLFCVHYTSVPEVSDVRPAVLLYIHTNFDYGQSQRSSL